MENKEQDNGIIFEFVKGASNIKEHQILSSRGGRVAFDMHKLVVLDLPFVSGGKTLEEKWEQRERPSDSSGASSHEKVEYWMAYTRDAKTNEPISMASGVIKGDVELYVNNMATNPIYRQSGHMEGLMSHIAVELDEKYPSITAFHPTLMTTARITSGARTLDALNQKSQSTILTDPKAERYGVYNSAVAKSVQAAKDHPAFENLYINIPEQPETKIVVSNKLISKFTSPLINEKERDGAVIPNVTMGASTYNFSPKIIKRESLIERAKQNIAAREARFKKSPQTTNQEREKGLDGQATDSTSSYPDR